MTVRPGIARAARSGRSEREMTVPDEDLLVTTAFQTPVTDTGTTATPSQAAAVAVARTRVSPSETITGTAGFLIQL